MTRLQEKTQQIVASELTDRVSTRHTWQTHHLRRYASAASKPVDPSRTDPGRHEIKPTALLHNPSCPYDTCWYDCWVRHQMASQPRELYSVLQEDVTEPNDTQGDAFTTVWREIWAQASIDGSSIDSIVTHLLKNGHIKMGEDAQALSRARNLVFAVIGWQTMLFRPDMGSCPKVQLAIVDETDGHRGHAYMDLRQDENASRKALYEFLMGYGVLLPCHKFDGLASDEDKKSFATTKALSPDALNMHLLTTVGGIHIKWVDSLACHLELDADSNTLYLFRFPSFCAINLLDLEEHHTKTTLHSCAAPPMVGLPWGTHDEVNDLLREILLSYRLLFGQDKTSRRLFRSLNPFEDLPEKCKDPSLSELCGTSQVSIAITLRERDSYVLNRDFPVLRSRLALLAQHFSYKRPRTWKELWNDKRDSASWFTFWAVLLIGGVGILLAFVQVVLQIMQVSLQMNGS